MIPTLDVRRQYEAMKGEIDAAVAEVLTSGRFIDGPNVAAFENELAAYTGAAYAVTLNSGTDALHLALRALGIGAGDEVITTPFTFIATVEAIAMCGATPVFADVEPSTLNIDPAAIEAAITTRTCALLPVHLYGLPAAIDAIEAIAHKYGLAIVEDCAQALGARIGERRAGTIGAAGAISFFPSKNLGAYGDGGAIVTNDPAIAQRVRRLRTHGAAVKYHHEELGVNSRLDELQAAILRCKLPHLEDWIARRREVAAAYHSGLGRLDGLMLPPDREAHTYHQFTIRIAQRDAVAQRLLAQDIASAIYYPVPLHLQRAYAHLGLPAGSFPHAERAADEVLSLPIFPEMERDETARVVTALREACRSAREPACAS